MGGCQAKSVPVPPGKEQLVGTWVSSPAADKMKVDAVTGNRYKKGVIDGLTAPDGEWDAIKLTIEDTGKLHYVHVTSKPAAGFATSIATLIDLPATQWTHKEIYFPRRAPPLEYSLDQENDTLIINGTRLRRSGAPQGGNEATMRVVVDGNREASEAEGKEENKEEGGEENKEEERQDQHSTTMDSGRQDMPMQVEAGAEGGEAAKEAGEADGGDVSGEQAGNQEENIEGAENEAKEEGATQAETEGSAEKDGDTEVAVAQDDAGTEDREAAKEGGEQERGSEGGE